MSKFKNDEQLLERLMLEDEELFSELFYKYRTPFKRFFLLGNKLVEEEAEEIYVQAYTTFWQNIKKKRLCPPLKSSLLTYLIGIGNNYLKRFFESKSKNRDRLSNSLEKDLEHASRNPEILDTFEREDRKKLVEHLLSLLDESCRELLLLSFVREYSDEAIMEEMKFPSTLAVRQKRFRCLKKLRNLFKKDDED